MISSLFWYSQSDTKNGVKMDTPFLNSMDSRGREQFEAAVNALQGDVSAAAARLSVDPRLRLEYSKRIKVMAEDLRS